VTTNPRTLRRVRRRNRRLATATAIVLAIVVVVSAWGLDLQPASAASGYNADTDTSIADIQSFWAAAMPDVYGRKYTAIPDTRIYPY